MGFKRILFWLILVTASAFAIRYYSERNLEWVHWKRIGLYTNLDLQFKGGSLDKIREKMDVFLERYDTALSDQVTGNAFEILSRSPKNTVVQLNDEQQKLLTFIQQKNQSYFETYAESSPFQIGVAEWLYYYKLLYREITSQTKFKSKRQIKDLLQKPYFVFNKEKGSLKSLHDFLRLTLGGLSKGNALLELGEILQKKAVKHFLINAGGDIFYQGLNMERKPWKIGIRNPASTDDEEYLGILTLPSKYHGLATSGIYENYIKDKGKKRNHIINPTTGESITDKQSLTVLAKDPLLADFYATFLFLLPVKRIFLEAERLDLEVLIIDKKGKLHLTEGMKEWFKIQKPILKQGLIESKNVHKVLKKFKTKTETESELETKIEVEPKVETETKPESKVEFDTLINETILNEN